jgi:DNA-binding PadR family transcriptional regulator
MKFRWILMACLWEGRKTGYAVKKEVDADLGYFWHVKGPQVYTELKSLARLGWVERERGESQRGPDRQYYSLTEAGREALTGQMWELGKGIESRDDWKAVWWVLGRSGNRLQKQEFMRRFIAEQELRQSLLETSASPGDSGEDTWPGLLDRWSRAEVENNLHYAQAALEFLMRQPETSEEPGIRETRTPVDSEMDQPPAQGMKEDPDEAPDIFADLRDSPLL